MRVEVEFLGFHHALDQTEVNLEFTGNSVSDVIGELSKKIKKFREAILKEDGRIDEEVLVILNNDMQLDREALHATEVNQGDTITFMLMAGGG
jgi:molybdopterin converting factor small subunit